MEGTGGGSLQASRGTRARVRGGGFQVPPKSLGRSLNTPRSDSLHSHVFSKCTVLWRKIPSNAANFSTCRPPSVNSHRPP